MLGEERRGDVVKNTKVETRLDVIQQFRLPGAYRLIPKLGIVMKAIVRVRVCLVGGGGDLTSRHREETQRTRKQETCCVTQ